MRTKNKKKIFIILQLCFVFVLGAAALMNAEDVFFNNAGTKIKSSNVQGAIEELDKRFKNDNINSCSVPSTPNLNNNLIPVTIADDGTVTYADVTTKWYDYCNKQWANSVILVDNPSQTYGVNDVISEDDIKAYFVWIPKYKYRLWNVGTTTPSKGPHPIDIVFDTENTIDVEGVSCVTPMTANNSGNCNDGEYMTHPAFISMNVNGFWMGKFDITGDINNITIKPSITSLRSQTVKTFFESMYYYSRENNSHMMKQTEWGAAAYLSHSKFGINNEVNINNNSNYITGSSALPSTDQHAFKGTYGTTSAYFAPYNTAIGYLASTTGNITGVYDMSGCAWEYMAAYVSGSYKNSGFNASSIGVYDSKYFDVYPSDSTTTSYHYRILGDATGEMGPVYYKTIGSSYYVGKWYTDMSYFLSPTNPWAVRSGKYEHGALAGIFHYTWYNGAGFSDTTSRMVLSP